MILIFLFFSIFQKRQWRKKYWVFKLRNWWHKRIVCDPKPCSWKEDGMNWWTWEHRSIPKNVSLVKRLKGSMHLSGLLGSDAQRTTRKFFHLWYYQRVKGHWYIKQLWNKKNFHFTLILSIFFFKKNAFIFFLITQVLWKKYR